MNLTVSISSLFVLLSSVAIGSDPQVTRSETPVIRIDGADYAFISPSPRGVGHGIPIMYEIAWADETDGGIEFVVDPDIEYQVNSFVMDDTAPNGRIHYESVFSPPGEMTTEEQLDSFIRQRIAMEEEMAQFVADNGLDFFDISAAIQRVASEP